jgi:hypothetical protein
MTSSHNGSPDAERVTRRMRRGLSLVEVLVVMR